MFNNKKEIDDLKQEMTDQLSALSTNLNQRLNDHEDSLSALKDVISELKANNSQITEKVKIDLKEINSIKSEFQTALNRLVSVSRTIEETAASNVKEVAEKEIETIQRSSRQFRDLEEELRAIVRKINTLQLEISKFISISQQIRLVDFTLQKHQEEMSKTERERMHLINENENLKSMMAKMKRGMR